MGSGLFGTNLMAGRGFFGFDPTPGYSATNAIKSFTGSSPSTPQFSNPTGTPQPSSSTKKVRGVSDITQPQVEGASTVAAPNDPYAKYGGQSSFNNLTSGFDTQKQNIYGTAREGAQNAALGRQSSILDYLDSLRTGQQQLDERGIQNELAKRQGTASITDMVGRGIRSGGTFLANRNASDSSAAEQIAKAYGSIGQGQLSGINNQYELENRNIGMDQANFDTQRQAGVRKFDENKIQAVNGIVADARNRLAQLDAAMVDADMPTRIQIEQEREAIKQEALGILSQYDQQLTQGVAGVNPAGTDANRRTAADLANRGVAASNPFDFTAEAPAQFQNSGPFASELPLFTLNRQRRQEA